MTSQVTDEELKRCGKYFDLDDVTNIYSIANKNIHWTDAKYYIDDEHWNEDLFYDEFEEWWNSLTNEERRNIFNQMQKFGTIIDIIEV